MDNFELNFEDLQAAVDSGQWRRGTAFLNWIFEEYTRLVRQGQQPPANFGSKSFWGAILGEDSEDDLQEGGRMDLARNQEPAVAKVHDYGQASKIQGLEDSDSERSVVSSPELEAQKSEEVEETPTEDLPASPLQHETSIQIDDFFELSDPVRTYLQKYNLTGMLYVLKFRNQDKMEDLGQILLKIFEKVLDKTLSDGDPNDRLSVSISHPALQRTFHLGLRQGDQLTAEQILTTLEQLVQSAEEFDIDDELTLEFTRVKPRRGGRPREPKWNHRVFMEKHSGPHGGCFIRVSNPNDNLCLARAVVVAKARLDKETDPEVNRQWESIRKGDGNRYTLQKRMAQELMRRAGLENHDGACGEPELMKIQSVLEPEYQIKVFSAVCCNCLTFQGKIQAKKVIYLYHDVEDNQEIGHYIVCTKPHVIFNREYWCDKCNKGFNTKTEHKCREKCYCCYGLEKCEFSQWKYCHDCNRWFVSQVCFDRHTSVTEQKSEAKRRRKNRSICEKFQRCLDCGQLINKGRKIKSKHSLGRPVYHYCGKVWCTRCDDWHKEGEQVCFIQPIEERKKKRLEDEGSDSEAEASEEETVDYHTKIFFDFECMQEKKIEKENYVAFIHEPTHCVATKICDMCKDIVRSKRGDELKASFCKNCGKTQQVFRGENSCDDFCTWLFSEDNRGAKAIAHNSKGYDSQFLIQYLLKQTLVPQVLMNGTKLMMMSVDEIKVIDSLNFLPMALSELPKSFNQTELKKGFFPHKFNKPENWGYEGTLPDAFFYDPGNMREDKRKEFYTWYTKETAKRENFNFQEQILAYCKSDVDILMRCCLSFEEIFMEVTGVRPFDVAVTIAGACMHVFRKNFMKLNTIAIVPHGGYRTQETQSVKCLKWLAWLSRELNIRIQHAKNGGEKRIGRYKVDGFDRDKTVYEFHGCVWHGCKTCFPDRFKRLPNSNRSYHEAYERTLDKISFLQDAGYHVVELWECEFERKKRREPEFRLFIERLEIVEPLNPRDALKGGRTNATRLYFKCGPDEAIHFKDICSLYPFGLKYTKFPVGHPTIITENFQRITKRHNPYFGLIKCRVLPPDRCLHPVLPYKTNEKLYFPLCRVCAEENHQGFCYHDEDERTLEGTWITPELDKASEVGYELKKILSVWHYPKSDIYDGENDETGLFTRYINCFLKLKIEASGWPSWVKTEEDAETFIIQCEEREGIKLDPNNIKKNAGMCSLAKLMLNSFWGKFGQRVNMGTDVFVSDPDKFAEIVFDPTNLVEKVRVINEEMVMISYKKDEDFVQVMSHTNPVIAAFTTGNCRLKLYEVLQKLGDRVCYFDTDSVIYITRPGDTYHPEGGSFLGDWTDELETYGKGSIIEEFISGGPKNYSYAIRKPDGKKVYKVKIGGFTLNHHAASQLNFKTLKEKVKRYIRTGENEPIRVMQPRIERTKEHQVVTKDCPKNYGIVYEKRWLLPDGSTLPYGTKKENT